MSSSAVHRPYRGVAASARREQRRATFVEAGLNLFDSVGYQRASIDGACEQAGLTKRYFYESFDSLESFLIAVYDEANARVRARVRAAQEEAGSDDVVAVGLAGVAAFIHTLGEDRRLARVMFREIFGVSQRVDDAYLAGIAAWKADIGAVANALPVPGVRPDLLVITAWGLVTGTVMHWVLTGFSEPADEIVATLLVVLTRIMTEAAS